MNETNVLTEQASPRETPQAGPLTAELEATLREVPVLESVNQAGLEVLANGHLLHLNEGDTLVRQGAPSRSFWILLSGSLRARQVDTDDREIFSVTMERGASLGEVALLASVASVYTVRAASRSGVLALNEQQFWALMTCSPDVRQKVLGNMAIRLQKMQQATFQQEKMASLGTMAAGLMHELNNPGAAARRAATQLRGNLMLLHRLSSKFANTPMTAEQKGCMFALQDQALEAKERVALSSLDQSDAEEALAEWMESASIAKAWEIAPSLSSVGLRAEDLECARHSFEGEIFSDALSWLAALVSSMQLVSTIEESIGRVSDLVMAVKSYAYEGRGKWQSIDINKSIHATLVILGHKLREKQIVIEKALAADLPTMQSNCGGLNQVWTNLLDNAIDASEPGGRIAIRTWAERTASTSGEPHTEILIEVQDTGSGIPIESQAHIFDPFYTTKPAGVGTGLGLGIVHRIVEQFGGSIRFSSVPGETIFLVRLPSGS